jgi:putative addiction module CopG family antidote
MGLAQVPPAGLGRGGVCLEDCALGLVDCRQGATLWHHLEMTIMSQREGLASVNLGSTRAIAQRLVAEGRFENVSDACRAGLRRLEEDARVVDRLVRLGEEGMASGIDEGFDIDAFVGSVQPVK